MGSLEEEEEEKNFNKKRWWRRRRGEEEKRKEEYSWISWIPVKMQLELETNNFIYFSSSLFFGGV